MLLDAARAEAANPSAANLPPSGELIRRDEIDQMTGARSIKWHGRRSFIADMGRPAQHVVRILDPKTRSVLMGLPLDRY